MKLIVVDDNHSFLEAITFFLQEKLCIDVIEKFESGVELLKSKKITEADIILLDIEMPDMSGLEVAKQLLYHHKNAKLVAITNHNDKVFLDDLIYSGFKGFVPKNTVFDDMEKILLNVAKNVYSFPNQMKLKPNK